MKDHITLQAAVRALMRGTGMTLDEARHHLLWAIRDGKLPLYWENTRTKEIGRVPPAALGPKLQ